MVPVRAPRRPLVRHPPGSSEQEIAEEPDWGAGHEHRIGYRNRQNRYAGITHHGDHPYAPFWTREDRRYAEEVLRKQRESKERAEKGDLLNFQQIARVQTDFRDRRPDVYPPGWRTIVEAREDWIKNEQDWPANIVRREKQQQQDKEKAEETMKKEHQNNESDDNEEHDWRRDNSNSSVKHHDAYAKPSEAEASKQNEVGQNNEQKTEYQKLRETYSPQEITLLRHLQHERDERKGLKQDDGQRTSPVKKRSQDSAIEIDAMDAMTPDNWIPRSDNLIRNTGQHPLNAETRLEGLFSAGLITPNELHYVRSHGSVPRLYWDTHVLDVCDGALKLSMDDLKHRFKPLNIPVTLACDGNRRGELNMIKKSKGFSWGPGAVGCAFWKGPLLADVLAATGVKLSKGSGERRYVNFEGADEPAQGTYATSVPLDYCLDPSNDVILAYEMNNTPLPPDHGYPVRLIIPGYVGGRCIKWLARIWITDHENDSYYHIYDNRILPSFITEKDGEFARTMFNHPSTACMEQNLNSVIVRPCQGEEHDLADLLKRDTYRVEGFAYDGGGHEIQRVELSLDGGKTWLYCLRHFPDRPIRHGTKFWTWIHWHIDVDSAHFARTSSLTVRCFNVFKNTQPEHPVWNIMGMMNNVWYTVKVSTEKDGKLLFRHPYDQEGQGKGWMTPSTENQLADAKQKSSAVPDKQFTRAEIEKHSSNKDCWLVLNNNVYDVTSVLSWHPGGSATILAWAGKLSLEVTSQFESIHDDFAHKKLQECAIGRVTDKAAAYMLEQAKADAAKAAKTKAEDGLLQSKKWLPVKLIDRKQISKDTFTYTFSYDQYGKARNQRLKFGLGTCQHIQFGIHMMDKMLMRSYTPTRPISPRDEDGTFDLTVKTYFPDEKQPGGAFSNFLHELPLGQDVEVCGPTGNIVYLGNGAFEIEGKQRTFHKVNLILGGSGLTPGYALLERVREGRDGSAAKPDTNSDRTEIRLIDANKSQADILLRDELHRIVEQSQGRIQITHVLDHPQDQQQWEKSGGLTGYVTAEIIKKHLFPPPEAGCKDEEQVVTFLCGPPAMIQKAALPALKDWGFTEDENCFGF